MTDSFPSPSELKGAVQGTLLYIGLYFLFVQYQAYTKFYILAQKKWQAKKSDSKEKITLAKVKYYNSSDHIALNGDRTVGNFVEYAFVFLSVLWMHALFVDPSQSFTLAVCYTFSRSYYPVVFKLGPPWLFCSTVPGYVIIMYMMQQIVSKFAFV